MCRTIPSGVVSIVDIVQFVEENNRPVFRQPIQPNTFDQARRPRQDEIAVLNVVPVCVGIRMRTASGCLPHLPGPTHKSHLPMLAQMLGYHVVIQALSALRHMTIIRSIVE